MSMLFHGRHNTKRSFYLDFQMIAIGQQYYATCTSNRGHLTDRQYYPWSTKPPAWQNDRQIGS